MSDKTRDDSVLYSGATSASYGKQKRERQRQEKLKKQAEFVPKAPLVFDEIEKQKAWLGELLLGIVDGDDHEEEVMMKLNAVRLHRTWIHELEQKLKIVLKAKPKKAKDETDV